MTSMAGMTPCSLDELVCTYRPVWSGPFKAYTEKYLHKNLWRVSRTCDFDDAMQEARIVFLDCSRRYAHVDNPAWFMSLYKRSLAGRLADLSTADTRYRSTSGALMCDVLAEDAEHDIEAVGELANEGELMTALRQAPAEVQTVLSFLLNAPSEILELVTATWRAEECKTGETYASVRLCRMLGLPERTDLLTQVRAYFG